MKECHCHEIFFSSVTSCECEQFEKKNLGNPDRFFPLLSFNLTMITGDKNVSYFFHMSNLIIVSINQEALKILIPGD